jgi:cobalt-precorrin-5B (C1)-methyltransferase
MILLFGGTTEGLEAAHLLSLLNFSYIYSTKTATSQQVDAEHITSPLDQDAIVSLCRQKSIKLMIDAAHPFAVNLHQNISHAAQQLSITTIRFDREETDLSENGNIHYFDDFEHITQQLKHSGIQRALALSGVQTIQHFNSLKDNVEIHFRILNTPLSSQIASQSGIAPERIHPGPAHMTLLQIEELVNQTNPQVILTKESGESGYLSLKAQVAKNQNIPLWIVKRPVLPPFSHTVTSVNALNQCLLRFRKEFLKDNNNLRKGYTTGSCATAAAKASLLAVIHQKFEKEVEIHLPSGEMATMRVYPQSLNKNSASCVVIKDAGDDPDVTHACDIGCHIELNNSSDVTFKQGTGIGLVTLPGLQIPVGEPAINPTPRLMMSQMAQSILNEHDIESGITITPYIPEGKALADKTFNPRIGIQGGISIIGTSGRVMPYSNEAFINALRQQLEIARHTHCPMLVATSGRRSELLLQKELTDLPLQAFVHHGNMIGEALQMATENGFTQITLGIMLGKAVKLAKGHLNTHSSKITFNPHFVADIARQQGFDVASCKAISQLTLANAITDIIPFSHNEPFYIDIARRCWNVCQSTFSNQIHLSLVLLHNQSKIIYP